MANFQSLLPKIDALKTCIHTCSADIVIGTETWLSDNIDNSELAFSRKFPIFRKERVNSRGGAVVMALKENYNPKIITIDSPL